MLSEVSSPSFSGSITYLEDKEERYTCVDDTFSFKEPKISYKVQKVAMLSFAAVTTASLAYHTFCLASTGVSPIFPLVFGGVSLSAWGSAIYHAKDPAIETSKKRQQAAKFSPYEAFHKTLKSFWEDEKEALKCFTQEELSSLLKKEIHSPSGVENLAKSVHLKTALFFGNKEDIKDSLVQDIFLNKELSFDSIYEIIEEKSKQWNFESLKDAEIISAEELDEINILISSYRLEIKKLTFFEFIAGSTFVHLDIINNLAETTPEIGGFIFILNVLYFKIAIPCLIGSIFAMATLAFIAEILRRKSQDEKNSLLETLTKDFRAIFLPSSS